MFRTLFYIAVFFLLGFMLESSLGCIKEYSFEGREDDTIPTSVPDTLVDNSTITFPICQGCINVNEPQPYTWNFRFGTSLLCGNITRAVKAPDHTAFTFFGPSACSIDTGLVMTVYFGAKIVDADASGLSTNDVIFQYYDNVSRRDIFMTDTIGKFSLTIDNYKQSTGIAKGRFGGFVPDRNGDLAEIKDGKFLIKFDN